MEEVYEPYPERDDLDAFSRFQRAASLLLGEQVKIHRHFNKHWYIEYFGGGLEFYFVLFDPINEFEHPDGFCLDRPLIRIIFFAVFPHGQGLGSEIMRLFIDQVRGTVFERIVLRARDDQAARFWLHTGFTPSGESGLCMYQDLQLTESSI